MNSDDDNEEGGNDSPSVRTNKTPPGRNPPRTGSAAPPGDKKPSQKKSMAKQKDSMGRCTVRPQRAKDALSNDKNNPRGRNNKDSLVDLYALLFERVPFDNPTEEALARVFSDKELRVLMGMNKMLINDFDPKTGKYTEKTKQNKIKVLLPNMSDLAKPEDVEKDATQPKRPARPSPAAPKQVAAPAPAPHTEAARQGEPEPDGTYSFSAETSDPDSPVIDPAVPDIEPLPFSLPRYNFDFAPNFGLSPDKVVTPLQLPHDVFEDDVVSAGSHICAAMAVHFTESCEQRRSPRRESAEEIQSAVLQAGVDAYRSSSGAEQGELTRMDEVVADDFMGKSLRIVDVRAFSRSLRYPSTLDIVVSQLQQAPGSMATFLYGHGNFRDIQRTGSTLFIGYFGSNSDGESIFVAMDPRLCHHETGFPHDHCGNPAMLVFLSSTELRQHLHTLLRGDAGGDDASIVDWQASFLEVLQPAESMRSSIGEASALFVTDEDPWYASAAIDAPDLQLDAPTVDVDTHTDGQADGLGTPTVSRFSVESAPCDDMDELEEQLKRSSLDEDSREASMKRCSLDELDQVLPPLMAETPPLVQSVQEAINVETAKQAAMMDWQTQMNARMLKSRQEHERKQRLHAHASQQPVPAATTPPDDGSSRKRRPGIGQMGAAIRKRGPRSLRKSAPNKRERPAELDELDGLGTTAYQHTTLTPHAQDLSIAAPPEVRSLPAPTKEHSAHLSRYFARREGRDVVLEVSQTGINVVDGDARFFHLTTILSWRVRRSESGRPVGFKLVFTDGSELVFSTEQGREISDVMMQHAQGLAALMHNGMHVRGTTMVN